jgi:hypothetical protein
MAAENTTEETIVSRTLQEVIREAKRIEERSRLTSKSHFKAAAVWANLHLLLGIPAVVLAAIASALVHSQVSDTKTEVGIISVAVAALTALQTFLNPSEREQKHLVAGNNYASLENRTRIFWTIQCWQEADSDSALTARVLHLSEEDDKLKSSSPAIPGWAYFFARRAIAKGETTYEVDKA